MRPFNARSAWIVSVTAATLLSGVAVEVSARQTAGVVQGVAFDEKGAPLAGVEVTARYQSNPGGDSISSRPDVTDGNGHYSIDISQPAGTWSIHGSVVVDGIRIDLTRDTEALFEGYTGAIRNLRVQYLEQTAESEYGIGGIVQFDQPLGDYSSIAGMQVTLRPADGGPAITRTIRQTGGEGWVATGFKPGTYAVSAQLNGAPMLLTTRDGSNWATSITARFTADGFDTGHMRLLVKAAPPGTQPPPGGYPPPDNTPPGNTPPGNTPPGNTPPASGEHGTPTNVPVDQRRFDLARSRQTVGRWTVEPVMMAFKGSSDRTAPNQVRVWVRVTNTSPLPQAVSSSFRFALNGRSTTFPSSRVDGGSSGSSASGLSPYVSAVTPLQPSATLASGQSAEVAVTFPIAQNEQTGIRSMTVTAIEQPVARLLGQPREVGRIDVPLFRRPASDAAPATQQKTDLPATQPPAPQPTPQPAPTPTPSGHSTAAALITGDVQIIAPVETSGDWSLQLISMSYRDGPDDTLIYADLTNRSRSPIRLNGSRVNAIFRWGGGGAAPTVGFDVFINSVKQSWNDGFTIQPGQSARVVAHYRIPLATQQTAKGWLFEIFLGNNANFELRLPPRDAAFVPQSPPYVGPVDPAPTPAAESAMRALEGIYDVANIGQLTLRYEGGLLVGETRTGAGQPVMDTLRLAMPEPGKLRGVMQRPNQPPSRIWFTLDLTVSPDRSRLEGAMGSVHPPINTDRAFSAQRSVPAPTPTPAPSPSSPADPARFGGTFTTSRGTTLTLSAEGGRLVGQARGEYNAEAESLRLYPDGPWAFTGQWRETTNNGLEIAHVRLNFNESSPDRFRATVTPMSGVAPFEYEGLRTGGPETASAAPATPAAPAAPPSGPTRIGAYDVVFVSAQQGADGDWESTWSLTNRSQTSTVVNLNDLAVTMRSADGQTSVASGPYHHAGETGRRVRSSGFEIAPGEETRIRFWHSRSARMTPVGYSFRAGPVDTPIGGESQSAAGTRGFQRTAYLEMKVDRVTRAASGGVEVTLTARHDGGVRRGVQHDPQRYSVMGSDGVEYAWDGNYYGGSGAERLSNTLYLIGGAQGTVTYVFPRIPAGVTPARLILRQDGQQTASFELPK